MPQISYDEYEQSRNNQGDNKKRINFFSLKNDKDEAVVRIMHDTPADFDIMYVHPVQINGKFRKVNCIRDPREPMDTCPFCEAGQPLNKRIYIHLIEYTKDETGKIVATPKIWERSSAYITTLKNFCDEYTPLSDNIFKIKRNGVAGSMDTTYDIIYANPTIYRNDLYVKDPSLFENVRALGTAVIDADYNRLKELLNPPVAQENTVVNQATSTYTTFNQPNHVESPVRSYTPDTDIVQTSTYNANNNYDMNSEPFARPKRLYN